MAQKRVYAQQSIEAVALLGQQIKLARKERRWSEQALAQRGGISRGTLQKIEKGDLSCAIGLVFELASIVSLPFFASDQVSLPMQLDRVQDKIALLPQRLRAEKKVIDDDF